MSALEASVPAPKVAASEPIREIQGLLTTLSDQIAQIESRLDHLLARVAPVCSAQVPQTTPGQAVGETLISTQVGEQINQAVHRLRSVSLAIGDAESRIQL